jgi:hypothetical protein
MNIFKIIRLIFSVILDDFQKLYSSKRWYFYESLKL